VEAGLRGEADHLMSEGTWVIVGGLLAGGFLIAAQLVASSWQSNISRDASAAQGEIVRDAMAAQAAMAREARVWGQRAQEHAAIEAACLEVIRYAQQIATAVHNWETGAMAGTQALASINSAASAITQAGYGIFLRRPDDRAGPFIWHLLDEANKFTGLNDPARTPAATVMEKRAQAEVVANVITQLYNHLHTMLKADAEAS
jgi:hypothetical protein